MAGRRKKKNVNTIQGPIDQMRETVNRAASGKLAINTAARQLADMTVRIMGMAGQAQMLNRRVKTNPTPPQDMKEDDFKKLLEGGVKNNEEAARGLSYALSAKEYTYKIITKTYQDVLTYRNYAAPCYDSKPNNERVTRELALLDAMGRMFRTEETLHAVTGRALMEGKAFYWHDYKVNRRQGRAAVNRLIPLPSDWCLIIETDNPVSKYTVAFDMGYFYLYPDALGQLEGLFAGWLEDFNAVTCRGADGKMRVDEPAYEALHGLGNGNPVFLDKPLAMRNGGRWQYWVALPVDKVWTFEIDDVTPWAAPIFTGLFKSLMRLANAEDIFFEITQNPLISMMTGEIPYMKDNRGGVVKDGFAMSVTDERNTGYRGFHDLFYEMWQYELEQLGTKGVGGFFAPFTNMDLHQLAEAPNSDKIMPVSQRYAIAKSGLAGLIPATDSVMAGQVAPGKLLAAAFAQCVYRTFERMFNRMTESLGLEYEYEWHMFGDIFSDNEELARLEKAMSLGMLADTFKYNALKGRSVLSDLAMSRFVLESGLLGYRMPLQSSYHARQTGEGEPGAPAIPVEQMVEEETEKTFDYSEG